MANAQRACLFLLIFSLFYLTHIIRAKWHREDGESNFPHSPTSFSAKKQTLKNPKEKLENNPFLLGRN